MGTPTVPTRKRTRLFKAIALLLPILLLAIAELLLRLFGYGHDTALFVKDPDDEAYYVMNPYASSLYFSDTVNATKGNIERFPVQKEPGTVRIFVLGESTTAGYPYMHNGSFHRWLLYRLMHEYPDRNIEMINVSLTAVNSYTVLGFARQLPEVQPDAILIYTGHNEYYGALGVGSTSHIGGSRFLVQTVLWLRHFRLVQGLENMIRFFGHAFSGKATDTRENLMQRMAAKQTIPLGSKDFNEGVSQFHDNMDAVCRLFSDRHIPVFLSDLVSNEKDQLPFISAPGSASPAGSGQPTADQQFRAGDSAYHAGNFTFAKNAYRAAKEADLLRFRAPDTLNGIIHELCRRYNGDIHLVETRALFESNSPHGILGKETLLEHVHPNLFGYALMSEAFYDAMKQTGLLSSVECPMSFETLLQRMPVTRVDSLNGAYQVMMLKTRWPFHEPIPGTFIRGNSIEEKLAGALSVGRIGWLDAMDQLFKYRMQINDKAGALQVAEATMLEHPENKTYLTYCGRLSFEAGYWDDAVNYFKRLYRQDGSTANALNLLIAYIKTDQPQQALVLMKGNSGLSAARTRQRSWADLLEEIIRLEQLIRWPAEPLTDRTTLGRQVAIDYKMLDAPEAASRYDPPIH